MKQNKLELCYSPQLHVLLPYTEWLEPHQHLTCVDCLKFQPTLHHKSKLRHLGLLNKSCFKIFLTRNVKTYQVNSLLSQQTKFQLLPFDLAR